MEDCRELFDIVGEVEGMAAERAAELPPAQRARLVRTLNQINGEYARVAVAKHPSADLLFALDTRFHRAYVDAGAGPRLLAWHDVIKPQTERYIRVYQAALLEAIRTSVAEHASIIRAIQQGRAVQAQHAVRSNWRNAARRLRVVIGSHGETGAW
jgi:DNA-binding GntR family transcriptional regulator